MTHTHVGTAPAMFVGTKARAGVAQACRRLVRRRGGPAPGARRPGLVAAVPALLAVPALVAAGAPSQAPAPAPAPAFSTEALPAYLGPLAMVFLLWLLAVVIMLVRDWWGFRHDIVDDARTSSDRWERRLRWLAERDRERQAARRERLRRQSEREREDEHRRNGTLV